MNNFAKLSIIIIIGANILYLKQFRRKEDCDGRQVLEMIRSEPDFSTVPVIFLTGKNDKESVMKVTALKPDGYLLKTMEPDKIVQTIDDFFEKRKGI